MIKKYGFLLGLTVIILLTVVLKWGYVVSAEGDMTGPDITNVSPQPGGTITFSDPQQISFRFNDPANLDTNVILQVDGLDVNPTITWDGLFATQTDTVSGSTYEVRIGDDYTNGVVTAQLPRLSPGEHTVFYNTKDVLGNVTQNSYILTLIDNESPQIVERYPFEGQIINSANPTIIVRLSDAGNIVSESVYLNIDEKPVDVVYDSLSSTVTYMVIEPLSDGPHAVTLIAVDEFGNRMENTWSFNVSINNRTYAVDVK